MDKTSGKLTVFFEEPFWVGVFERISDGKLSVCKVTFGAEPKDYEVWEFILKHYCELKFSPDVEIKMKQTAGNPKRRHQVLYHLGSRGIEYDLLPWHREHNIPVMAYCSIAQAGALKTSLMANPLLNKIAEKYNITVVQLLLLFATRPDNIIAILRRSKKNHVLDNAKTLNVTIDEADWKRIDEAFPPPKKKMYLDIV